MNKVKIFFLLHFFLIAYLTNAQTYSTSSAHAEVHGTASIAPDYTGVSGQLEGVISLDKDSVDFQLSLKTLETGNSTRDGHMYDALEVSKYPKAQFKGKIKGSIQNLNEPQQINLEGDSSYMANGNACKYLVQ